MRDQEIEPRSDPITRRDFLTVSFFGTACAAVAAAAGCTAFQDTPGPGKNQFGRAVNAISAVSAGLIAQAVAPGRTFEATIEKYAWPDASMHGKTTDNSIQVSVDLSLTSCKFTASGKPGAITGDVEKSEFDWKVKQSSPGEWEIGRTGWKFDHVLKLTVDNGTINGTLVRTGGFDWTIEGSYSDTSFQYKVTPGIGDPSFSVKGTLLEAK